MMNIKVRDGFTLIEVLLALLVTGTVLVPLFFLYNNVVHHVAGRSYQMQSMFISKQFLFTARKQAGTERTFELQEYDQEHDMRLQYSRIMIGEQSAFAPYQMMKEVVTVTWKQFGQTKQEQLVAYMYAPKPPEKKTEGAT